MYAGVGDGVLPLFYRNAEPIALTENCVFREKEKDLQTWHRLYGTTNFINSAIQSCMG